MITVDNSFEHYGIPGMRWRKGKKGPDRTIGGDNPRKRGDTTEVKGGFKPKKVKQFTDSELKKANNRLQMEVQYKRLQKENASAGKKFVSKMLEGSAEQLGKNLADQGATFVSKQTTKGVNKLYKKMKKA